MIYLLLKVLFPLRKLLNYQRVQLWPFPSYKSVQVTPFYGMIIPFITTKTSGISGFNHQKKPMITPSKNPYERPSITMNKYEQIPLKYHDHPIMTPLNHH